MLGKQMFEQVRDLPSIGRVEWRTAEYLDNTFHVIITPGAWAFHMLECWHKGSLWASEMRVIDDWEEERPRTDYAAKVTGAYYAARLAVYEHMLGRGRSGACLIWRDIGPGYWAPVGVWLIREAMRDAMNQTGGMWDAGTDEFATRPRGALARKWEIGWHRTVVQSLQSVGLEPGAVTDILLTHHHWDHVGGAQALADALARHPQHFDELYIALVDAGERSGALETLLDKIAAYKEKTEAIKSKVRKALFYPTAVVVVAIIVVGILLYFVVPQFQSLFAGFGADLPAFTLLVIGASRFMQHWWWLILLAIGATGFGLYTAHKRSRAMRRATYRLVMRLPVIGSIVYKAAVARFARTLSTMFAAGVPLVDALDSVARAAGNVVFEDTIFQVRNQVATGQSLALATENTGRFPSMAQQMMAIGEEAGALDAMCARVADFYESAVDDQVDQLSSLLEPFIMAIIGVLVGGIVVAMYLPIFKLGSVV